MGRLIDVDDLVGAEQIAERYGITRQAVDLWTRKPTFPQALIDFHGRIWAWPDVAAWRDAHPPRERVKHGSKTKYNRGCRCDECRAANTEHHRRRLAAHPGLPEGDPRHGTKNGYCNYACRCGPCKVAGSLANLMYRQKRLARSAS